MITKEKAKKFVKDNFVTIVLTGASVTALCVTGHKLKVCKKDLFQADKIIAKYVRPFIGDGSCTRALKYIPDTDARTVSDATKKLIEQINDGSVANDIVTGVVYYVKK